MALRRVAPSTDLLLVVMGSPHQGELVTTLLRLVRAALDSGRSVQVWACGYATQLTQTALGEAKPTDLLDRYREHPTTASLISALLQAHPDQLYWYGCRTCGEHRGARHIDGVPVRSPHRFAAHVGAARRTIYMGTA
ncbi:hypothetical protein ACFVMC_28165 [Nocardia sp. NPDC127579]|uniref:hypothetical protein n=1 Tax=Nocardia sp. NPDC127579 TaxID=3345402 RepID=UPI0036300811